MRPTLTQNSLALRPADELDPRLTLDEGALVAASRNAFPIVAQRTAKRDNVGLVGGAAVALLLGGVTFWSMSGHRVVPVAAPVASVAQPAKTLILPHAPVTQPVARPSLLLPQSQPLVLQPKPATAPSPLLVVDNSTSPASTVLNAPIPGQTATAVEKPAQRGFGGGDANDQFTSRIGGEGDVQVATAHRMSDPAMTVTQGTLIPAVLETAINTDLPGYVRAVVSEDVKSFDGSRVLVPRSSRLIGQYKSGLAAGQTRAYVIWSRLIRPDGVSVALASPAVDFAGRSGLDGKVDSHFLKRFGAAALLTVIGGLSAIGNNSVVLSSGQNAGTIAAQGNVQIPPTVRVPQGQPIRVFTARDLDFSSVAQAG